MLIDLTKLSLCTVHDLDQLGHKTDTAVCTVRDRLPQMGDVCATALHATYHQTPLYLYYLLL